MSPSDSVPDGLTIIVDPDIESTSGDLVVAKLDSGDELTLGKLIIDDGSKYLLPFNPQDPPHDINGECIIVGKVTTQFRIY